MPIAKRNVINAVYRLVGNAEKNKNGNEKEKIKRKGMVPCVATPLYFIEKTALQWPISAIAAAWFVNCT